MERRTLLLGAVASHLLLTALHGVVHAVIPVFPNGWTAVFAVTAVYLLPIVGAGLALGRHRRTGAAVLCSAGVASFGFEGAFHFLFSNPDHVSRVADHHTSFVVTAILTTVEDLLLVGVALNERFRGSSFSKRVQL